METISPTKEECNSNVSFSSKSRNINNNSASKLARRARSFKDDFLDILAAMRSPSSVSSGSRSSSPKSKTRNRSKSPKQRLSSASDTYDFCSDNPLRDLEFHVKQVQLSLRHFQDVVARNKLEVLPGNGTVVLETVANIHCLLKPYALEEQSSSVVSALNQVYQSIAKLIRLCDDLLICGEKALDKDYVAEVVRLVEDAVQNLITITNDKMLERDRGFPSSGSASSRCSTISSEPSHYRVSLPDIPLTPHELKILEETSYAVIDRNGSSPRICDVNDTPPGKPPLPHRTFADSPPPLPPKRRIVHSTNVSLTRPAIKSSLSLEGLSLKSDGSSVNSLDSINGSSRLDSTFTDDCSTLAKAIGTVVSCSPTLAANFASVHSSSRQQQHSFLSTTSTFVDGSHVITTTHRHQSTKSTTITALTSPTSDDEVPPDLPLKQRKNKSPPNQIVPITENRIFNRHDYNSDSPPPLPPKKKHIMAYMEMFGNCSHGNTTEFLRHSVHTYSLLQAEWQQSQTTLSSTHSCSFNAFSHSSSQSSLGNDSSPPALPPKRGYCNNNVKFSSQSMEHPSPISTPPPIPPLPHKITITESEKPDPSVAEVIFKSVSTNDEPHNGKLEITNLSEDISDPLAETDVTKWLTFKKSEEDGPDVRGGHQDALIVLATKASKNAFIYQEAFLTTYRTFLSPQQLIGKLIDRYQRFDTPSNSIRQKTARESFSLLVRVVGDLTCSDLDNSLVETLMEFVYQLLCNGDLLQGKALRVKILEKYMAKLVRNSCCPGTLSSQNIYTRQSILLDFKSEHLAEQMTLLDAELFMNIEIPEVLNWVQEQNEEKSPNLTLFTEHFNKMSYWARSRILEQNDAKERERYVLKFIKIMKHLRKMNNFNSYLALLSALDSAPIRRLEWQKNITEGLKEYCALIDSTSSFRAYRQALADTQPPCIPYIGLVLQDLTFVHIGNNDCLPDGGMINFAKRWQQFNILENMKRFKKTTYNFKTHERIVAFFSNFDEFLCEEAMWQISESIKPRGKKC